MISRSFERRERIVRRTSATKKRDMMRYTKAQHRPASRHVNDHGRVSGTHTQARDVHGAQPAGSGSPAAASTGDTRPARACAVGCQRLARSGLLQLGQSVAVVGGGPVRGALFDDLREGVL